MSEGGKVLIFVPFDRVEGQEDDPLARILREYVTCTGEVWIRYEKEKRDWEDHHVNATQTRLLEIHMKAMEDIIALGYTGKQASEMLGTPTSVDIRHFS